MLWKFARDHKIETFASRCGTPGLLTVKGELRKRAPRRTIAQRDSNGRYIKNISEYRKLTEAIKTQIIYNKQREIDNDRTQKVQRMKKERKKLEEDAKTINERIAASWRIDTTLNAAIKQQMKEINKRFQKTLDKLNKTKNECSQFITERKNLRKIGRRYAIINRNLANELQIYKDHFDELPQPPFQNATSNEESTINENIATRSQSPLQKFVNPIAIEPEHIDENAIFESISFHSNNNENGIDSIIIDLDFLLDQ